jgi:type IV pilus assembly protein PilM
LSASGVVGYSFNRKWLTKKRDDEVIIKRLHAEAGASSRESVISIRNLLYLRSINSRFNRLGNIVKWESEQYIPIPVSEAIIQHSILQRNETSSPPEVLVLLVAAPRATVEKYVKVVTLAGLTTIAVETELIALTRALAPIDKTVILVDIGAGSTDIAIAKNGLLSFSRSIPIAGEAFTRAVSQGLGINATQAEEYKKTYGLADKQLEGKIKGALDPVLRLVVDEIKKAINYYQTEEKGEAPSAIVISGGTSGMPDIMSMLSSLTGMEVLVGAPFSKIGVDAETAKKLSPYSPLYAVAVGLALREP